MRSVLHTRYKQQMLYCSAMPKVVDPQERREEVLSAAWRVIQRDGLKGATIRAIAAEAGASTAVVTHYFRNKDEVLRLALDLSHARIGARRQRKLEGLSGLAALETALLHMLPLDAERQLELHIEVNFWVRAISDEDSRRQHLVSHDRSVNLLTRLVAEAAEAGDIDPALNAKRVAEGLLAFIDGLGVDALMHPNRVPPARQRTLLRDQLARLAPPAGS
jgi:AcrR family transcriptional regulator